MPTTRTTKSKANQGEQGASSGKKTKTLAAKKQSEPEPADSSQNSSSMENPSDILCDSCKEKAPEATKLLIKRHESLIVTNQKQALELKNKEAVIIEQQKQIDSLQSMLKSANETYVKSFSKQQQMEKNLSEIGSLKVLLKRQLREFNKDLEAIRESAVAAAAGEEKKLNPEVKSRLEEALDKVVSEKSALESKITSLQTQYDQAQTQIQKLQEQSERLQGLLSRKEDALRVFSNTIANRDHDYQVLGAFNSEMPPPHPPKPSSWKDKSILSNSTNLTISSSISNNSTLPNLEMSLRPQDPISGRNAKLDRASTPKVINYETQQYFGHLFEKAASRISIIRSGRSSASSRGTLSSMAEEPTESIVLD